MLNYQCQMHNLVRRYSEPEAEVPRDPQSGCFQCQDQSHYRTHHRCHEMKRLEKFQPVVSPYLATVTVVATVSPWMWVDVLWQLALALILHLHQSGLAGIFACSLAGDCAVQSSDATAASE